MKRKKINKLRIIGLILILVSILICSYKIYKNYKIEKETEQVIETYFQEVISTPEVEESTPEEVINETPKEEIKLTSNYLGYIELINYGVKRLITNGTDRKTLDKGLVGMLNVSSNLDDEFGNVILAGHSVNNTFKKLHSIKIGEQIKIVSHKNTYIFEITEKHTINDTDMSYFNKVEDKKILTLITCKTDNNKRLIVIAELRGN